MIVNERMAIQKQARIVGFTYLTTTIIGLINNFIVKPGLKNSETLLQSELQFRTAQILDILMFILVIWMAVALYLVAGSINKTLAKLVFVFRLGEGVMGFVTVLFTLAPLVIMKKAEAYEFNNGQLNSLATMFFDISKMGWNIHFISMSIGAIIFIYLVTFSSYIPKWLGFWGLFTYISVLVCFSLQILLPKFPSNLMMIMAPGALFEFTFGLWLMGKGVNIGKEEIS